MEKGNFRGVLLAHPGTQHSFRLARELNRLGRLAEFHTSFAVDEGGWVDRGVRALNARAHRALSGRILAEISKEKIRSHPLAEAIALVEQKVSPDDSESIMHRRNARFQKAIPDRSIIRAEAVIGFDTSSWILGQRAKSLRRPFILDRSIGDPIEKERIFETLRQRFPAWLTSIPRKSDDHLREEALEHAFADWIVVPGGFVKATLVRSGVPEHKIRIIPYGIDLEFFSPSIKMSRGKVIFLFVGSLSARKGVPVLMEAWRMACPPEAELWIVGPGDLPGGFGVPVGVKLFGRRSRSEVAQLMRDSDVFIFPSFFEGLAMAQIEALASGLPVIGTPESGAEDIVVDGKNGFVVAAGDITATADRIRQLARNRDLLAMMQNFTVETRASLSWRLYGDRWSNLLDEVSKCSSF